MSTQDEPARTAERLRDALTAAADVMAESDAAAVITPVPQRPGRLGPRFRRIYLGGGNDVGNGKAGQERVPRGRLLDGAMGQHQRLKARRDP